MLPGSTIIRQCSACGKYLVENTILSGNTFGARCWTDGKQEAPMLPDQPWLVKCSHCNTLVWIDEQTPMDEVEFWTSQMDDSNEFPDARWPAIPTLQEYADFVETDIHDPEKEYYVRLRLWWAGNDLRRGLEQPTPLSSLEMDNLRAFLPLLDETDDDDRIMKAEVFRELGKFAAAEKLLVTDFDERLTASVSIISDLCQKKMATVTEMTLDASSFDAVLAAGRVQLACPDEEE